ncbi:hypothetical protein HETIRDRAFT_386668 [Heterobasidion irregulare TC 32-1]|uniref:Uncharacterized protein n=1 Tax=Heterobasidion irregulare (strain TC 32-1) TaxID=747525 RepID=W4K067_HETIT|nr:uncharacterized protein HETIRDRAFT_386668 [Heterobasidion irregulare TC 32-1]ETW78496.1 hypothetical protein HETIRDRAFT_386668 [Heterobasidion irregulare TC 32-1]
MRTPMKLSLSLSILPRSVSRPLTVPFLPVRDDFKSKRNQARPKLATLRTSHFKDLSSDTPGSTYDDFPSPDFAVSPRSRRPTPPPNRRLTRTSGNCDCSGSTGIRRKS